MRRSPILFLALSVAVALGACDFGAPPASPSAADPTDASAAGSAPTAGSDAGVTITFGAASPMRQVYEPLISAFNAQHPGITVQFVSLDSVYKVSRDYNEQVRAIVSRADTVEAGVSEEQFNLGLVRDLKPLMDADPSFNRDDFYPGALSSATSRGGAIYKLPQTLEVPLLFYNKDLWAARGVAAPKSGWTWQDLEAAAQQLAQRQGGAVKVYGLADEDAYLAVLLAELKQAGLDLAATPPASAQVDRPEVAAALQRMVGLFQSGAFFYPPHGSEMRDAVPQMVLNQQIAMWGPRGAGDLVDQKKQTGDSAASFAVGVAPYPLFPGGARRFANGYVISSGTQHPSEAWAWLSYLSAQPTASQAIKGGSSGLVNVLPARKSLAEQSGYWARLDEQARAAVQAALDQPAAPESSVDALDAYQPLIEAVREIIGGKNASQAASEAQVVIAQKAAQAQQTSTATANVPVVVATPVPNIAPPGATTITFGIPLGKGGDELSRVIQQFNQSQQEVFVQPQDTFTGNDILPVPQVAAQSDCFMSPFSPAQSELTATLDLQPLIDSDASFKLDDYPAALLTPYRQANQLRGLPWGFNARVLVYNKNLFDAAGLQTPSESWTTDDLLNAAQKLTSGQGDTRRYGLVIPRNIPEAAKFLVHLFGAATTQASGETLRPNFTDPKVVQAVRNVVDLLKNATPHAQLNDNRASASDIDYDALVGDGRAGMWFAWGLYAYGQDRQQFTIAMAPPPLAQAVFDADDISTSSMYISAQTDKQQACWTWLKYFSASRIPGPSNIPARRSVAQSETINQEQPGTPAVYEAYAAALGRLDQLAPGGDVPGTPPIDYYWFYRAIDRGLQGKNLEQELAQAQALTEQYVACARAGGERHACGQQVDPSYSQH